MELKKYCNFLGADGGKKQLQVSGSGRMFVIESRGGSWNSGHRWHEKVMDIILEPGTVGGGS